MRMIRPAAPDSGRSRKLFRILLGPTALNKRKRLARITLAAILTAVSLPLVMPGGVLAQEPGQVAGLGAVQDEGFTTLSWDPVDGAIGYEIERTPVDEANQPTGDERIVGIWQPTRTVTPDEPTFADSGFVLGERFRWRVRASFSEFPNQVTIDEPSSAAGTYEAQGASFGPPLDEAGVDGDVVLVNDGSADPTLGCDPFVGFPAGSIALLDRGECTFVQKVRNAQAAGATAVIVVNNLSSAPINMTGTAPDVTIPSVMVWQSDGDTMKAGLPATGTVQAAPGGAFSEPVFGTTQPQWGDGPGASLRTEFEQTNGESYTSDVNEYAYTAAIDEASNRVRVVEIGRTLLDRPINMFIFGYPEPPPNPAQVSETPTILIQCHVHGNEPSMRESCLILARELAFTDDPDLIQIMERSTLLIIPTLNGDGRAANTRGSSTGQDLNRDHSLLREPETKAFSGMLRDYTPDVAVDGHNGDSEDLPVLGPRHLNIYEGIYSEAKNGLIESWIYDNAAASGWYAGPYSNGGASQETILRNTFGLKSIVGILSENRGGAGPTRPNATSAENEHRKSYGQLWLIKQVLNYHYENHAAIRNLITQSTTFQRSNVGPIVFRGSYPWPLFPPLPSTPDVDSPDPEDILEDPPCGYFLTEEQFWGDNPDGTVAERLILHGIQVHPAPGHLERDLGPGYFVRMTQPLRGLIPLILDAQAAEPMVDGTRLQEEGGPPGPVRCSRVEEPSNGFTSMFFSDYTSD